MEKSWISIAPRVKIQKGGVSSKTSFIRQVTHSRLGVSIQLQKKKKTKNNNG